MAIRSATASAGAGRRRRSAAALSVACAACCVLAALLPSGASARDAIVRSFDGTPIVTHFFPAPGLERGERAPTIMIGHGWGGTGANSPPRHYASRGYNVLTWDARGFGGSGGTVMIDHPRFEARDAQALIDFIARQPEARLDGRGDPRVGMDGPSYGGGVQFITAARDRRVDAIAPTIAWNSLRSSLYKHRSVKAGWGSALAGLGIPTSALPGVFSPAGVQTGHQSRQFYDLVTYGLSTGRFRDGELDWLVRHGPRHLLGRIEAPTLIAQGTVDTLFTLEEADRNYRTLKRNGVPARMMWFCGGHGACRTESDVDDPIGGLAGDGGLVRKRKIAWFARWLKGRKRARTGPPFEWIGEDGIWRASRRYPLRRTGTYRGRGSGLLALTPGVTGSGVVIYAAPSDPAIEVPIDAPPRGANVVGEPRLKLVYSATGLSTAADGRTHVFAQIVDDGRGVVVNNLATPIPIRLDGERRELTLPLERIASRSTGEGYTLQIVPQTNVYDVQRATGAVTIERARVALPVARPVR